MALTLTEKFITRTLLQIQGLPKICSEFHTHCCPLLFRSTQQLWAEPMKKKKRVDPALAAARQVKKLKKLEKEIKKLTRFGRILKPVEELEMNMKKLTLAKERKRSNPVLPLEEAENRALLAKEWANYRKRLWANEYHAYKQVFSAQHEALEELKLESMDLYLAALQIDYGLVAVEFQGPKLTPPIKGYQVLDGEYVDVSRKY